MFLNSILIYHVSGGQALPLPAPSGPSNLETGWRGSWDTFDEGVISESWPTKASSSSPSVNQGEEGPSVAANPVASRGEEAGPSNRLPRPYPYHADEMIGGDCLSSIQRRLLSKIQFPSPEEIERALFDAEDLFEVKVDLIQRMAVLDPRGDWMGQGARALDNPRTATGEPSLERLLDLQEDLNRGGVQSEAFADLKKKMIREREVPRDENSVT